LNILRFGGFVCPRRFDGGSQGVVERLTHRAWVGEGFLVNWGGFHVMDFDEYREHPILGDTIFAEPAGGLYGWTFFAVSVLFTLWMFVDRGYKVAVLAGGGLLFLSVPHILPERYYPVSVMLRIVGLLYYVALWVVILVVFPDAPTFFEGNW